MPPTGSNRHNIAQVGDIELAVGVVPPSHDCAVCLERQTVELPRRNSHNTRRGSGWNRALACTIFAPSHNCAGGCQCQAVIRTDSRRFDAQRFTQIQGPPVGSEKSVLGESLDFSRSADNLDLSCLTSFCRSSDPWFPHSDPILIFGWRIWRFATSSQCSIAGTPIHALE